MKLKQISVFLENKPGQLQIPIQALADAGISISTLCLADTQEFGILRMIVQEHERARDVLAAAGLAVNECQVLAVEVPDAPGGLQRVLQALDGQVNVEYMYAFSYASAGRALLIFRVSDPDKAAGLLAAGGINVLDSGQVFLQGAL